MQVDPIKPTLKPPGSMHLNLRYDGTVSNFAFKLHPRRYMKELRTKRAEFTELEAGANTRSLQSST